MALRTGVLVACAAASAGLALAYDNGVAKTPPMGWNCASSRPCQLPWLPLTDPLLPRCRRSVEPLPRLGIRGGARDNRGRLRRARPQGRWLRVHQHRALSPPPTDPCLGWWR